MKAVISYRSGRFSTNSCPNKLLLSKLIPAVLAVTVMEGAISTVHSQDVNGAEILELSTDKAQVRTEGSKNGTCRCYCLSSSNEDLFRDWDRTTMLFPFYDVSDRAECEAQNDGVCIGYRGLLRKGGIGNYVGCRVI